MRQRGQKKLQKIVDSFNAKFPVGSPVVLRKDSGIVETTVRAPAEILGGHSAVGWFDGIVGCYAIDGRVSAPGSKPSRA